MVMSIRRTRDKMKKEQGRRGTVVRKIASVRDKNNVGPKEWSHDVNVNMLESENF